MSFVQELYTKTRKSASQLELLETILDASPKKQDEWFTYSKGKITIEALETLFNAYNSLISDADTSTELTSEEAVKDIYAIYKTFKKNNVSHFIDKKIFSEIANGLVFKLDELLDLLDQEQETKDQETFLFQIEGENSFIEVDEAGIARHEAADRLHLFYKKFVDEPDIINEETTSNTIDVLAKANDKDSASRLYTNSFLALIEKNKEIDHSNLKPVDITLLRQRIIRPIHSLERVKSKDMPNNIKQQTFEQAMRHLYLEEENPGMATVITKALEDALEGQEDKAIRENISCALERINTPSERISDTTARRNEHQGPEAPSLDR